MVTTRKAEAGTRRVSRMGQVYAVTAFVEAVTWAGLLCGMYVKYIARSTEVGVQIFGPIHGTAFMVYVLVTITAAIVLRWRWWVVLLALLASIPPMVTVLVEMWMRRTGRLVRRRPDSTTRPLESLATD